MTPAKAWEWVKGILRKIEPWLPWILIVVGLWLIIFPNSIRFRDWYADPISVREVGVIFLIAGVATLAVERQRVEHYTKTITDVTKEKIEEIRTASIEKIFRGALPEEFFSILSEVMLEQKFLRRDQQFEITLDWRDAGHEYLQMYFSHEYRVTNMRKTPEQYSVLVADSLEMEEQFPETTLIRYLRAKPEGAAEWAINESDCRERSEDGLYVQLKRPLILEAGQTALVSVQTERVVRLRGEESYFNLFPLQGVSFTVHCPPDLEFVIEAVHPKSERMLVPISNLVMGGQRRLKFVFSLPMLPYWGFVFNWKPRPAVHAGADAAGAAPR